MGNGIPTLNGNNNTEDKQTVSNEDIQKKQENLELQFRQFKDTVNHNFELIGKMIPLNPENFISEY